MEILGPCIEITALLEWKENQSMERKQKCLVTLFFTCHKFCGLKYTKGHNIIIVKDCIS